MWTCPTCNRIFEKTKQTHSCKSYPIELHFKNKDLAKRLYDELLTVVRTEVGTCQVISLSCCVHWFGTYDFIALLPKKDKLEVRFALDEKIASPRIYTSVQLSSTSVKNCLYLRDVQEIDNELLQWIKRSYILKDDLKRQKK